jgi:hypothetical protein
MSTDPIVPEAADKLSAMPRRQFLFLGSAAVVGAAAVSLTNDFNPFARIAPVADASQATRLSIGFTRATAGELSSGLFAVTSADKLRRGDASLAESVKLRVHGLIRAAKNSTPLSIGLDAMHRVAGLDEEIPFLAWTYDRGRAIERSVRGFVLPSSEQFSLAVVSRSGAAAEPARSLATFSAGTKRGAHKLRRGTYFFAHCAPGTKAPEWELVRAVVPAAGELPVLQQMTLTGFQPVPFDYIVVTTDRA